MTKTTNIDRIVAERDFCWNLLVRLAKEAVIVQRTNKFTNGYPTGQNILCVALTDEETRKIESLQIHIGLGRTPVPTPLESDS